MELEALQSQLGRFKALGASLIALSPQLPHWNDQLADESGMEFPVVQDRENRVATAFGLTLSTPPEVIEAEKFLGLDLPAHNGTDHWDLPIPSRYVVDSNGKILFASLHVDHRTRQDPEACLDFLSRFSP